MLKRAAMTPLPCLHETVKLWQSDAAISLVGLFPPVDFRQGQDIGEHDVLLGRDKRSHSHVGNKRFRELIQAFRKEYQDARFRREKNRITLQIIHIIVSIRGGRFLKYDEPQNEWRAVGRSERYEKVSHALRSAREPAGYRSLKKQRAIQEKDIPLNFENMSTSFGKLMQDHFFQLFGDQDLKLELSQQHEPVKFAGEAARSTQLNVDGFDVDGFDIDDGFDVDGFDEESIEILCKLCDTE